MKPYRARHVEARLKGKALEPHLWNAVCSDIAGPAEVLSDIHASGEYRKHLAAVYARRGIEAALAHLVR